MKISSLLVSLLLLVSTTIVAVVATEKEAGEDEPVVPCAGGSCPATQLLVNDEEEEEEGALLQEEHLLQLQAQQQQDDAAASSTTTTPSCSIWMAPSPIKKAAEHGFGLGMFTGRHIRTGTILEEALFGSGEVLIPIYGSETIYETHPPLREYVWDEDFIDEVAIEDPSTLTALFMAGLAAIAPCTSNGFNLKLQKDVVVDAQNNHHQHDPLQQLHEDIHRDTNPVAGAVTYRSISYIAVRDIFPGEELTVECSDDSFAGGNYFLSRYNPNSTTSICLDHLQVQKTTTNGRGKGLFLKTDTTDSIPPGATILSTPVIPIHRREMDIDEGDEINKKQLLLNYCYGHENSDVLLLPYAPMVNALNHYDYGTLPNAKLVWHQVDHNNNNNNDLHRRQQYHHEELLTFLPNKVTTTHGMSLAMDVVAIRDIIPGDEITIDYGPQWKAAWDQHVTRWKNHHDTNGPSKYQTADQFRARQGPDAAIRTSSEQEGNPYPANLDLFCEYQQELKSSASSSSSSVTTTDAVASVLHATWNGNADCFRPCTILDRQSSNNNNNNNNDYYYTVRLHMDDNDRILPQCLLESDVILSRVPNSAIHLVDRPYSADVFMPNAFRHEIQVDIFPKVWMRQKLRRPAGNTDTTQGDEFKRKPVYVALEEEYPVDAQ